MRNRGKSRKSTREVGVIFHLQARNDTSFDLRFCVEFEHSIVLFVYSCSRSRLLAGEKLCDATYLPVFEPSIYVSIRCMIDDESLLLRRQDEAGLGRPPSGLSIDILNCAAELCLNHHQPMAATEISTRQLKLNSVIQSTSPFHSTSSPEHPQRLLSSHSLAVFVHAAVEPGVVANIVAATTAVIAARRKAVPSGKRDAVASAVA
jgi:hypothetical protein